MVTTKTLKYLAAVTAVLGLAGFAIGDGRDVLWILDDIIWFAFLLCGLALMVLTVAVLVRARKRSGGNNATT